VKVWQAAGNSADGIIADKDGNALVAQEDYDAVLKIDKADKASVLVSKAKGIGSLSMDRQGRLFGLIVPNGKDRQSRIRLRSSMQSRCSLRTARPSPKSGATARP
jgi:hypothetical protein